MTYFKKIIVLFWTLWVIIALWTDVVGGLAQLGWLQRPWAPNTNYPFLVQSLAMYSVPSWLPACFFIGIVLWELGITLLFIRASIHAIRHPKAVWIPSAAQAFIVALSLWFAFFIADQLVMKFDLEANHMIQGGMMLLTFLCIYLLPDDNQYPIEK